MVDVAALERIMKERKITQQKLGVKLGLSQHQICRKMKTGQFWPYEIQFLAEYLHIEHPEDVFFANFGTHNATEQNRKDEQNLTL